jgi:hypothetical protein
LVGDQNYPTYNGLEVIVSSAALPSFTSYMNSKKFPFSYDNAIGLFSKDLWAPGTSQTPADRSSLVGVAFISTVCGNSRYTIHEEFGGFQYVGKIKFKKKF